jgi:hypothetical protein
MFSQINVKGVTWLWNKRASVLLMSYECEGPRSGFGSTGPEMLRICVWWSAEQPSVTHTSKSSTFEPSEMVLVTHSD